MCLETDSVDLASVGFDHLDDVLSRCGLCAWVFDIVVVVVELHGRIGRRGCCERDWDICRTNDVIEDIGTVSAILVKC